MGKTGPFCVLALLFAVSSCGAEPASEEPTLPPPPATVNLSFAWPVPGYATVKRRSIKTFRGPGAKPDRDVTTRFRLQVSADPDEELLRLEQQDMEFLAMNGVEITTPELQAMVAPLAAQLVAGLPVLRIHPNGDYAGMGDWDAHMQKVEPLLRGMEDNGMMEARVIEGTLQIMRQPGFRRIAMQMTADPWNAWVGGWVGMELHTAEPLQFQQMQSVGNAELPLTVVYLYEGEDAQYPGHARLQMTTEMAGRELASVVQGLMGQVAAAMAEAKPGVDLADPDSVDLRMQGTVTLVTRPDNLLPRLVLYEKRITGSVAGNAMERVDSERWEFEWAK